MCGALSLCQILCLGLRPRQQSRHSPRSLKKFHLVGSMDQEMMEVWVITTCISNQSDLLVMDKFFEENPLLMYANFLFVILPNTSRGIPCFEAEIPVLWQK